MTVRLIWAQAANGVIGRDGGIPWHVPEDLAQFRNRTMGAIVVMGRTTWDSLPERFRPLPGRRNVVLTRDAGWSAEGAEVVHSPAEALALGDLWVIGGAQVYAAFRPYADVVVRTELAEAVEGDTYAPTLDADWHATECEPAEGWAESRTGLRYRVVTLRRTAED